MCPVSVFSQIGILLVGMPDFCFGICAVGCLYDRRFSYSCSVLSCCVGLMVGAKRWKLKVRDMKPELVNCDANIRQNYSISLDPCFVVQLPPSFFLNARLTAFASSTWASGLTARKRKGLQRNLPANPLESRQRKPLLGRRCQRRLRHRKGWSLLKFVAQVSYSSEFIYLDSLSRHCF